MRSPLPILLTTMMATSAAAQGASTGSASLPPEPRATASSARSETVDAPSDDAWNLSVGSGVGSALEITDWLVDGFISGLAGYDVETHERRQLDLRVDRELGRLFRAGVGYTRLTYRKDYFDAPHILVGSSDVTHDLLLVDGLIRWVRSPGFELYSGMGLGVVRWSERGTFQGERRDETDEFGAFQVRLIGLSAGGARLRGFAELGFGLEGILLGGLTLRL